MTETPTGGCCRQSDTLLSKGCTEIEERSGGGKNVLTTGVRPKNAGPALTELVSSFVEMGRITVYTLKANGASELKLEHGKCCMQ